MNSQSNTNSSGIQTRSIPRITSVASVSDSNGAPTDLRIQLASITGEDNQIISVVSPGTIGKQTGNRLLIPNISSSAKDAPTSITIFNELDDDIKRVLRERKQGDDVSGVGGLPTVVMLSSPSSGGTCSNKQQVLDMRRFIGLYEKQECLWSVMSKNYYNRDARRKALSDIGAEMGMREDEVQKKINSLRTYYAKEIVKEARAQEKGEVPEGGQASKWPYFAALHFLRHIVSPRNGGGANQAPVLPKIHYQSSNKSPSSIRSESYSMYAGEMADDLPTMQPLERPYLKRNLPPASPANELSNQDEDELSSPPAIKCERSSGEDSTGLDPVGMALMSWDQRDDEAASASGAPEADSSQSPGTPGGLLTPANSGLDQDALHTFGQHVANEIRQLPSMYLQKLAKLKIQQLLFNLSTEQQE